MPKQLVWNADGRKIAKAKMDLWSTAFALLLSIYLVQGKALVRSHNHHVATANRITTRGAKEELINADHTSTSFKIESRADDGEVRGVYSYIPFPGSSAATTVAYKAGVSGFRVVPLTSVVRLPPLPYSLQAKVPGAAGQNAQARQNFAANPLIYNGGVSWPWRFPVGTSLAQTLTGSDLVDQIISSLAANSQSSKINAINSDKDIEIDNESSAVVIEPVNDDGEIVIVGEGAGDSDTVGENIPKPDLPDVFDSVSAPLAQATVPGNGTAVADVVSVALATDQQGTAASKPTSQAIAGENGTAISSPVSTSIAGVGGIAIAGGQSIAVSGGGVIPNYSKGYECDRAGNCVLLSPAGQSAAIEAKSFDGLDGSADGNLRLPVNYLIPVVINNHFYGPQDQKSHAPSSS